MRNARGNDPAAERMLCAIYNVETIEEAAEARLRDLIDVLSKLAREGAIFGGGKFWRTDGRSEEYFIAPFLPDGTQGTRYYFTREEWTQARAAIRLAGGNFV